MKKQIKLTLRIVILLFTFYAVASCSALSKTKESNKVTESTEVTNTKEESKDITVVSEPIKDRVIINVPKSDNTELTAMFNQMMKQINTSKSSGSNSYNSKYDEELKQWVIDFTVAQTQNKEKELIKDTNTTNTFKQNVDEYIKTIKVPWWLYLIAFIYFFPQIKSFLTTIFNLVKKLVPGLNILK